MTTWHERTNRPAIPYDIEPQYDRALHGLHPAYFDQAGGEADLTLLAHDGWNPEWNQMWANNRPNGATWHAREHAASSWTRRDSF